MPRFFHDKNSKCTRAVFAGRLSQPSGSLLSGALGPFAVSTLPPAFLLFYHSGFENGSPRPIFRFGNLFRLRELPQRRQSPEGRRRIPLRRRGFSLRKRPRRRRNPGRMSKRLRTERRGRFQAGERCRQPWTRKPHGRRAGKRNRTGPGSRITPLRQKTAWSLPGTKRSRGESSKKCLSFSKAA
jgi:hypothetical protein